MKKVFSLILVFLIVFSLFGCGAKEEEKLNTVATDADIAALENLYKGREAYHGNLHDHSDSGDPENDPWKTADGKYPLDMWPNFLMEKDLDFVALVDHRQSNHMRRDEWDETMFMGATETGHRRPDSTGEIDAMHYNILLNDPDVFDQILSTFPKFNCTGNGQFKIYSDNPLTEEEFALLVKMVQEAGGNIVHVHPCWGTDADESHYMTSENPLDYSLGEYTGFEVLCSYSGGSTAENNLSHPYNATAYETWVTLLNMGKHLYAFAGSDSHRQTHTTSASTVYAEERLNDSYLKHIVKGDFTAGPVGIRMAVGDTVMGGHTNFAGKRLMIAVDDFQSKQYKVDDTYRLDVYDENGLVFSQEFDGKDPFYAAIDAQDCKYYRANIYNVTKDYIFAVGNPIWNEP
ncbi:MAG: hypothetical protein IKA47_12825 [Oscillospiraceae bacterium]|nr:hypothetical protein [Oscillospiraceae bacterium]